MKKLRNKKTGKVFDAILREKSTGVGKYSIIVCNTRALRGALTESAFLGEYDSLAKLCEEWEDYTPTEPLIKEEKARNVFREWAGFFGAERFRVEHLCKHGRTIITSTDLTSEPVIELPGYIGEDSEIYTKVELVGEEQE